MPASNFVCLLIPFKTASPSICFHSRGRTHLWMKKNVGHKQDTSAHSNQTYANVCKIKTHIPTVTFIQYKQLSLNFLHYHLTFNKNYTFYFIFFLIFFSLSLPPCPTIYRLCTFYNISVLQNQCASRSYWTRMHKDKYIGPIDQTALLLQLTWIYITNAAGRLCAH